MSFVTDQKEDVENTAFKGVVLMIAFCFVVPLLDVFSKLAAAQVPVAEIATARFILQVAFMLPVMIYMKRTFKLEKRLISRLFLRAVFLLISTFFFVLAISVMPIADALAIVFVEPFIILLLAWVLFNEKVGMRRISASLVGFLGVLLVIQPSFANFGYIAFYPLGVAFTFACYMLITRHLSTEIDPISMQFHTAALGSLICIPILIAGSALEVGALTPIWPDPIFLLWLLGVGFFASVSHLMMTLALQNAPSATLAPLHYLELIMAGFLGYIVFSDIPNPMALMGMLIVVLSGLYVVFRERQLND